MILIREKLILSKELMNLKFIIFSINCCTNFVEPNLRIIGKQPFKLMKTHKILLKAQIFPLWKGFDSTFSRKSRKSLGLTVWVESISLPWETLMLLPKVFSILLRVSSEVSQLRVKLLNYLQVKSAQKRLLSPTALSLKLKRKVLVSSAFSDQMLKGVACTSTSLHISLCSIIDHFQAIF